MPQVTHLLAADRDSRASTRAGAVILRFALYPVVAAAVLYAVLHPHRIEGAAAGVEEIGAIEFTQLGLLILCAISLVQAGREAPPLAVPLRTLVFALGIAFVRELDALFDLVFHGAWQVPAVALLAGGLYYGLGRREAFVHATRTLWRSRFAGLAYGAFVFVVVIAPTIGQQAVWRDLLGETYLRNIPRLIEELSELSGYLLLTAACVEACFVCREFTAEAAEDPVRRDRPAGTSS